jgi:oxalate decarboxylase/phosphoglucose isomerase-like protein (cupin superfamily)
MPPGFTIDKEDVDTVHYAQLHEGKGVIDVKFFFRQGKFAKPALLLTYAIPPGASEGVHTHRPGDTKMGSFDEFYYIISGNGEMQIAGNRIPVAAGDHVFTPNEVAHAIENTSESDVLKSISRGGYSRIAAIDLHLAIGGRTPTGRERAGVCNHRPTRDVVFKRAAPK